MLEMADHLEIVALYATRSNYKKYWIASLLQIRNELFFKQSEKR